MYDYVDLFPEFKERYPELFNSGDEGSFISFQIGNGWKDIVDAACMQLWFIDDVQISQVKEKFGGLRIYTNTYTDEVKEIINEAEVAASKTCEFCGSTEGVTNKSFRNKGSWMKSLCTQCREERDKNTLD